MSDYYLTCDSTVDLTPEQLERRQIRFVSFHFELDGKTYDDDMGRSMPSEELFRRMANGASTRTSHPSQSEYIELFEGALSEGKDVLHISFSSGLSGGWNTACLAQEELREKYPDRRLYVVDSLGASSGSGLIMETLADMRDAGADIDTLYAWIEANKLRMHHWFFSTDLSFYVRGGRISRAAGTVGTLLHICPLLNMNDAGLLTPREKIRTKRKTMRRTVEMMEQHAEGGLDYSGLHLAQGGFHHPGYNRNRAYRKRHYGGCRPYGGSCHEPCERYQQHKEDQKRKGSAYINSHSDRKIHIPVGHDAVFCRRIQDDSNRKTYDIGKYRGEEGHFKSFYYSAFYGVNYIIAHAPFTSCTLSPLPSKNFMTVF